jgi:hypothetical protein
MLERVAAGRHALFFLLLLGLSGCMVSPASAAAPQVLSTWVSPVQSIEASFHARFDCGGVATSFRFESIEAMAFSANLAAGREGFAGAMRFPQPEGNAGKCTAGVINTRSASGLRAETTYVYRVVAHSADGVVTGPEAAFTTRGAGTPLVLPDGRGWEMVSPVDKNGGAIEGFGNGVLQAAAEGAAVTYSSRSSFGEGGEGAPKGSQYLSRRSPSGWSTQNLTPPLPAGAYGPEPEAAPYQVFSSDLARGVLMGVPDPPLPGTGAPAGYANYYLRETAGGYTALLTQAEAAGLRLDPADFSLAFAGASPELEHVALSTCAALTPDAAEVQAGAGCDEAMPNLYEWSPGGLRLINLLPGQAIGMPPGRLAAPGGAVSVDGSRVYWTDGSDLYLREDAHTVPVDAAVGGGGSFQTATPDGAVAFFTKGGHLYRFDAASEAVTDLTPAGGVTGVLGASTDGSHVYFATAAGIFLAHGGITPVATAPDAINFPPSTGTARVSADGSHLLFVSAAKVTLYDSTDPISGQPRDEVYLYDANRQQVTCVSCNPYGEPPVGSATVPGAAANGSGPGATRVYKPRSLSADGRRVFFDSRDPLATGQDTNNDVDVYEWEAGGTGSCAKPEGCQQLISSGRSAGGATFVDASADGSDAFFLTDGSLVKTDPGAVDLYDAREGGGFPEPPTPIPCEEDACQPLPAPPDDPSPGSLVSNSGNPPVHFPKGKKAKKKHHKKHRARKKARHRNGERR